MGKNGGTTNPEGNKRSGGLDRRSMLKTAAAAGVGAAAWSAPKIETLARVPTAAAGTTIDILSPESDDKQSNSGNVGTVVYCAPDGGGPYPQGTCCGQAWGDNGKLDIFTFTSPVPGCDEIVVRTAHNATPACDETEKNPDVGQTRIFISSFSETVTGACDQCEVLEGVLVASSGRAELKVLDEGLAPCGGVDISIACDDPLLINSSRLAVRIQCTTL